MNSEIQSNAQCYIGYIENNPVCFFAIQHFPHPIVKNFKAGHRLVVLPDYQGLGIGHIFSSEVADIWVKKGCRFRITSSTKSLFKQRSKDKRWKVTSKGRNIYQTKGNRHNISRSMSGAKLTYSYEYIG